MQRDAKCIQDYFKPAPVNGGFEMDGWWVWCPSVMKGEDGLWHMFASRWPKTLPFHPGWGMASEVVRAVSTIPEGPYEFAEVVLPARGNGYWDGRSTHNPSIQKCGDEYILFYIGINYPFSDITEEGKLDHYSLKWLAARSSKRIGIATSKNITGPWKRRDKPVLDVRPGYFDSFFVSNPAPCVNPDGSCLLVYKARSWQSPPYNDKNNEVFGDMSLGVAYAEHYDAVFTPLTDKPIFSLENGILEDPHIWRTRSGYRMIAKDWSGKYSGDVGSVVIASSTDGVGWAISTEPAFSREILWNDGKMRSMGNMDRPFLLFSGDEATHLFAATCDGNEAGFSTMTKSWNLCIPLK